MLFEAAHWRPSEARPSLEQSLARPDLAKLLQDWSSRPGDVGVVARLGGADVGAAWYRFWSDDDHSYGYVGNHVPELAIAVVPEQRGRGIGSALLEQLLEQARQRGVERFSLSVERDNPAQRLYRRFGFERVGENGNAWTMMASTHSSPLPKDDSRR